MKFFKCILLLGHYVRIYGSYTARIYKFLYVLYDTKHIDLNCLKRVKILHAALLLAQPFNIISCSVTVKKNEHNIGIIWTLSTLIIILAILVVHSRLLVGGKWQSLDIAFALPLKVMSRCLRPHRIERQKFVW